MWKTPFRKAAAQVASAINRFLVLIQHTAASSHRNQCEPRHILQGPELSQKPACDTSGATAGPRGVPLSSLRCLKSRYSQNYLFPQKAESVLSLLKACSEATAEIRTHRQKPRACSSEPTTVLSLKSYQSQRHNFNSSCIKENKKNEDALLAGPPASPEPPPAAAPAGISLRAGSDSGPACGPRPAHGRPKPSARPSELSAQAWGAAGVTRAARPAPRAASRS